MSYASERANIEELFKLFWRDDNDDPLTPVAWDLQSFDETEESWVRINILSGAGEQITVGSPGSNVARYAGVVALQINTPIGTGSAESRALADKIEEIFLNQSIGGIRFRIPYPAGSAEENGRWSTWTIWCPFTREEFNA